MSEYTKDTCSDNYDLVPGDAEELSKLQAIPKTPLEPKNPLEKEYQEYLTYVASYTDSPPGANVAINLTPTLSPEEILASWELIEEARIVISEGGKPSLAGHLDLTPLLENLLIEGASLNPEELLLIKDEALSARNLKNFFKPFHEKAPLLYKDAFSIGDYDIFIETMDKSLSPEGEILETASDELSRIRFEISNSRRLIVEKLTNIMHSEEFKQIVRDDIVTVRKDRYVIPVRAGGTGKSRGLVHDWSQSGQTAYLEPLETMDDNNNLNYLKKKEQREIERIIKHLTTLGASIAHSLLMTSKILTKMDLYLAIGSLSHHWNTCAPLYRPNEGLELKGLRHPLLEKRLALEQRIMTPLDIIIEPNNPILVISGLNTGGKTVALKTLGLNLLIAKSGLFIHCKQNSSIDFPEKILCVMGDNQDLESDLSTFSGHLSALSEVLDKASPEVLILLDELGGGTDPQEGAALALAVMEYLLTTGAMALLATHFHLLKSWAALTPKVVSVSVNSSIEGTPSYGLSYGTPGLSGGLNMAEKLGLPKFIIDKAKGYLDENHLKSLELMKELENVKSSLAYEKAMVEKERFNLQKTLEENKTNFKKEIERLNLEAKKMAYSTKSSMQHYKQEFEKLKTEVKEAIAKGEKPNLIKINLVKAELEKNIRDSLPQQIPKEEILPILKDINIGDRVFIIKLRKYGIIRSWNKERKEGTVESGHLSVKVTFDEIGQKIEDKKDKSFPSNFINFTLSPDESQATGLSLLGHTVDEAVDVIDKEIDRAIIRGRKKLTIIHGSGTGKLKKGITDFLKTHPRVKDFKSPVTEPGGYGRTEVDLDI
jgi:DNA mismatch repair protein MutS2